MGTIRFLLAFSVVFAHMNLHSQFFNNGSDAVQLFFIISGFYMFMVLKEKYVKLDRSYWYFISNRFLRLYPIYFLILIMTIIYAFYSSKYSPNLPNKFAPYVAFWDQLDFKYIFLLGLSNLSLIGQELLVFFNYGTGPEINQLIFRPEGKNILTQFLFVTQAWSLGMEFWFYLLAPFLFKTRTKSLIIITSVIIISKILFLNYYSDFYNFKYRILLFEFALFLMGGISYNIRFRITSAQIKKVIFIAVLLLVFNLNFLTAFLALKWLTYLLFTLSIPTIFSFTKYNTFDKLLGELSYPIYISHALIISIVREFDPNPTVYVISIILLTIVISTTLNFITKPIETFRSVRLNKLNT